VRAIAAMKSFISAAATEMGEQCIHLHGGIGIADELMAGHCHKRLLVLATLFGDSDFELQRYIRLAA
jgi:alkylation response protein AidB-like acyl-CoA dehydrogenase